MKDNRTPEQKQHDRIIEAKKKQKTLKKDIEEWQKKADNTTYDTQFDDTPEFEERQALIQEARTLLLRCSLDL